MQRAERNIPLHVSDDERRRVEQEQERVLMLNQHQKDLQYFHKQEVLIHTCTCQFEYRWRMWICDHRCSFHWQMDRMKKREDTRHVADFNLALAEVQRRRRTFSQSHVSLCLFSGVVFVFFSDCGHTDMWTFRVSRVISSLQTTGCSRDIQQSRSQKSSRSSAEQETISLNAWKSRRENEKLFRKTTTS